MKTTLPIALAFASCLVVTGAQTPTRDNATPTVPTGTAALSGVVRDEQAQPLRRATVTITGDTRVTLSAVTDDAGRFAFTSLPAGRFTITARKPGYPAMSYGARRPNRTGAGVTLADGQSVTDLALTLAKGGVLTGVVYDDRGQPMPGVPVMAWEVRTSLAGTRTLDFPSTGGESVTTDDRGMYRVFGLPPGEYTVGTSWIYSGVPGTVRVPTDAEIRAAFLAATQPGPQAGATTASAGAAVATQTAIYNYTPIFHPSSVDPMTAVTVQLGAGEERAGIDLRMQFLAMSRIEVTIVLPEGATAGQIQLDWATPVQALNRSLVSLPSEKWVSPNLGPGDYRVQMNVPAAGGSPALWASQMVTIVNADPVKVELRLEPALTLTGRLVFDGATGRPADLSTVRVSLVPANPASSRGIQQPVAAVAADGSFSMTGVTPGSFQISATVPNAPGTTTPSWMLQSVTADGRDLTDMPVDIRPSDARTFEVSLTDRISDLSGVLTDAAGRPGVDYFVVVIPSDERYWMQLTRRIRSTRPDTQGRFTFRALPPGDYRIAATTDLVTRDLQDPDALRQLAAQSVQVSLAAGEKKTANLAVGR